jgi:hypothetical protein
VTSNFGAKPRFLRSLRISRDAAWLSRRRCTSMSRTSPSWSFGQQFLDIAVAQGEAEIEPDRVLDDLGREAMAAVGERSHADILSDPLQAPNPVPVITAALSYGAIAW